MGLRVVANDYLINIYMNFRSNKFYRSTRVANFYEEKNIDLVEE